MAAIRDIPLLISAPTSSSERRITPTWTVSQLKAKLEPITGIPPSAQRLTLRLPEQTQETPIEPENEDVTQIGSWPLAAYAEIKVRCVSDLSLFLAMHLWVRETCMRLAAQTNVRYNVLDACNCIFPILPVCSYPMVQDVVCSQTCKMEFFAIIV